MTLSETQIDYLIEYILKNYWSYTLSDLSLFTEYLLGQKISWNPKLQDVIKGLVSYSSERDEYAVSIRRKESGELKKQPIENDKIVKIYAEMKKNKIVPQNEKDKQNQQDYEDKLKEFKKMYPKKD